MKKLILFTVLLGFVFSAASAQKNQSDYVKEGREQGNDIKTAQAIKRLKDDAAGFFFTTGTKEYSDIKAAKKDFPKIAAWLNEEIKNNFREEVKALANTDKEPVFILVNMYGIGDPTTLSVYAVYEGGITVISDTKFNAKVVPSSANGKLLEQLKKSNSAAKDKSVKLFNAEEGINIGTFQSRTSVLEFIKNRAEGGIYDLKNNLMTPQELSEIYPNGVEGIYTKVVRKTETKGGYTYMFLGDGKAVLTPVRTVTSDYFYVVYPDGSRMFFALRVRK